MQYIGVFAGNSDIIRNTRSFRMIETRNNEVLLYLHQYVAYSICLALYQTTNSQKCERKIEVWFRKGREPCGKRRKCCILTIYLDPLHILSVLYTVCKLFLPLLYPPHLSSVQSKSLLCNRSELFRSKNKWGKFVGLVFNNFSFIAVAAHLYVLSI